MMQEARYLATRDALGANLSLQERLQETLTQLEQGINTNADHQAKIQAAALRTNRPGWYSGLKGCLHSAFQTSYWLPSFVRTS